LHFPVFAVFHASRNGLRGYACPKPDAALHPAASGLPEQRGKR
jgi:hypothetical protein